jgi:HAD superfamily hydrolase (TIGR01490 family)
VTGRRIIAVFDFDKTLSVDRSLESAFIRHLMRTGKLKTGNLLRSLLFFMKNIFKSPYEALKKNKMYLKGISTALATSWIRDFLKAYGSALISAKNLELVKYHKGHGHTTILISGTPGILIDGLHLDLWFDHIYTTRLEVVNAAYTGRIDGPHYYGKSKADLVMRLQEELAADLSKSFCYADSITDIKMMSLFGHPVSVNPDRRLRRFSLRHHWELIE